MRFGVVHRVMTSLLAAMGVMAVIASGELGHWTSGLLVVGLIGSLAMPEEWHGKPWLLRTVNVAQIGLLLVQMVRWHLFHRPLLELAVEFAAALQIVRLATRRGAAHDQQVIVLALIHLIAGTVLGSGLAYGFCFLGFLVVAPGALVLSHLRREVEGNYKQGARDRTGLPVDVPRILRSRRVVGRTFLMFTCSLALPIMVFTAALFLLFPRVGLAFLQFARANKQRMVGFDDRVDLGGVGELRANPTVALYVDVPLAPDVTPPERVALYLRGTAFDTFDGKAWSRSNPDWKPLPRYGNLLVLERPVEPSDVLYRIDLDHYDPPAVFLPPGAVAMTARSRAEAATLNSSLRFERGSEGQLRYRTTDDRGLHYEVSVSRTPLSTALLSREDRGRYLALPPLSDRVAALAQKWVEGRTTSEARARAIEEHLRNDYRYDLNSPSGAVAAPLEDFLFVSKRGHCEYYSSAMTVMMRLVGVPSRNVTGYVGGQYNRFSRNYVVRQRDAHSWVEVFLDGEGWRTFDPTPPSFASPRPEHGLEAFLRDVFEASAQRWDRHVVHYDIYQQIRLFNQSRNGLDKVFGLHRLPRPDWRWVVALAAVGGAAWAGRTVWQRWRPRTARTERRGESPSRSAQRVAHLYEQLDAAIAAQGLHRPQGLPPLRHAQSSAVQAHPLGGEILALTERYLAVRFGQEPFDDQDQHDFERRVRTIRNFRMPPPVAARASG